MVNNGNDDVLKAILEKYGFLLNPCRDGEIIVVYSDGGVEFNFAGGNSRGLCFGNSDFSEEELEQVNRDLLRVEYAGREKVEEILLWMLIERYALTVAKCKLSGKRAEGNDLKVIKASRDKIIEMLGGIKMTRVELMTKFKPRLKYDKKTETVNISYTYHGERMRQDILHDSIYGTDRHKQQIATFRKMQEQEEVAEDILLRNLIDRYKISVNDDCDKLCKRVKSGNDKAVITIKFNKIMAMLE